MSKAKKIFISGKITGESIYECANKFKQAQSDVLIEFWEFNSYMDAIIPLNIPDIHFGISHKKAMEICLNELKTCTHIYMLSDWKESKGAQIEHQFALENNIQVIYQK